MSTKIRKRYKRLNARIADYSDRNLSDPKHAMQGMKFHKPGSQNHKK